MRLPFVSRARYEALGEINSANYTGSIAAMRRADVADAQAMSWKALYEAERVRNDRLVQQLVDMKRDGFSTAAQRQAPQAVIPSKIDDAINEKAGSNGALRRHLTRWAAQRQAMNVSEDEIVDALTHWRDPGEVEA